MTTKTKTIINTRKADLVTEQKVRLRPGENVLSEEKARTLIDSKAAQQWRDLGWIRVKPPAKEADLANEIAEGGEGANTSPPGPMSAKDAIARASTEAGASALRELLEGEDRKTVRAAIERRLEELDGGGDESGDGEGDGDTSPPGPDADEG